MKKIFRPVEFWKSAVMTMPDNSFFELLRSVFGKIKTPFNKQQLLNELETFLLREDIQKTIAGYINQNDAKVIAVAALFGEPVLEELENFFSGDLSCAQLQDIIVNLEERFIFYRFTEEKISRLALNPVLEQILLPITTDTRSLFPTVPKTETQAASSAPKADISDLFLAGLLSFISQWEPFYRSEGVIRKRALEAAKITFPDINFVSVLGSLQVLGLFFTDEDKLLPDRKRFDDFLSLSARERMEYCAAALLVYSDIKSPLEILPPLFRGRIREIVNLIHGFLDSLNSKSLYPEKTIKRIVEILKSKMGIVFNNDALFETLEKTGLLVKTSEELRQLGEAAHFNAQHNETPDNNSPLIAIDAGLSILVYPEIKFADALKLASILNIREAGAVVRFELDKDSAVRAFDSKICADEIIELLKRLSGGKADDALIWKLKDWEKQYGEVALKKGVVLSLSEDRRYLTETVPLAEMIVETLAPGLYLLNENAIDKAENALRSAGIDIIARNRERKENSYSANNYYPPPYSPDRLQTIDQDAVFKTQERASALTDGFRAMLEKIQMGETEKAELSARIDRRLVLCEAQLKDANIRYEKLEARHMDYAGKQNIAKQAIAQQSPVEIVWPGSGSGESIFGVPRALEKEESGLVLVVVVGGDDSIIRIPLAKISLLRRIKKSIFEK